MAKNKILSSAILFKQKILKSMFEYIVHNTSTVNITIMTNTYFPSLLLLNRVGKEGQIKYVEMYVLIWNNTH